MLEKGGVETVEEAVKVNQRALVDKILARYSTEHTLFREMIQNADDASATKVQIRFRTEPYDAKPPPAAKGKQKRHFYGVSISNNGMPFREEDFARIKSICDGNPDETKIGFFGYVHRRNGSCIRSNPSPFALALASTPPSPSQKNLVCSRATGQW